MSADSDLRSLVLMEFTPGRIFAFPYRTVKHSSNEVPVDLTQPPEKTQPIRTFTDL